MIGAFFLSYNSVTQKKDVTRQELNLSIHQSQCRRFHWAAAVVAAIVAHAVAEVVAAVVVAVGATVAQSHSGEQKSFFLHPSSFHLSFFLSFFLSFYFIPKLGPQLFHLRSIFFDFSFFLHRLHLQVFVKLFHHLFQMFCLVFPYFFLLLLPLLLIFRFAFLFLFYLFY